MAAVKENQGYTKKQISNARRLIEVLEKVPEEKRDFVAMLGVAFLSGVESSETLKNGKEEQKV